MEHNRRARPTLRLLSEDLCSDWEDPRFTRAIAEKQWEQLHPMAELPHPVLRKVADLCGYEPMLDPAPRPIQNLGNLKLRRFQDTSGLSARSFSARSCGS